MSYKSGNDFQGFVKRVELVTAGQQLKAEKADKLKTLRKEMDEITKLRTVARTKMDVKNSLAAEAKKKHEEAWESNEILIRIN